MSQLELKIERPKESDRNYHLGGRSFYFFDFDDNVAFLTTPLILFHKETGEEMKVSSGQWAAEHINIGKSGTYKDFEIRWEDQTGTFRCFRDHHEDELRRLGLQRQLFVEDVAQALGFPDIQWKGPSWSCFYHAAFNQRPVSVITARGHSAETIKAGVKLIVEQGHLPLEPNYLSIYPVSNVGTRHQLGDTELTLGTAELKQRAIRASVQTALQIYGYSPHHRFGMSDDDPRNIQLIIEEMTRLKTEFPEMSFFMIETQKGEFVKHEISLSGLKGSRLENLSSSVEQIRLF